MGKMERQEERKKVGKRVRFFRTLTGYRQDAISLMLGVSQKTVVAIETGLHLPNYVARERLSQIIGVTDIFLLTGHSKVFTCPCVYFRPVTLCDQRYREVESAITSYFVGFMEESHPDKIYELSFEGRDQYSYIFEVQKSIMVIDVGKYRKLILDVLDANSIPYEKIFIKVPEYEDIINFPSDSFLIYSFLNKKGELKLFDKYISRVKDRQEERDRFFVYGLIGYIESTLSDYHIPKVSLLGLLESRWRDNP